MADKNEPGMLDRMTVEDRIREILDDMTEELSSVEYATKKLAALYEEMSNR